DSPERTQLYQQIQDIVVNEGVAQIFLYRRQSVGLGQEYVHDDTLHPTYFLPALEAAWMEPQ
ncbi:MAG: hypothetical protein M3Q45_06920, partial [Chloroflexota bacterium]|nr:hypothetical protein [Chloroflexota bacterium]